MTRAHEKRFRLRRSEGFTLIEVMIALVIMGVGLLTIALAQLTAMRMQTSSKYVSQAMMLAEQQLELFYVLPPTVAGVTIDPTNPIDPNPLDDDLTNFTRQWNVQLDTPSVGLDTVTVTVVWNNAPSAGGVAANQAPQTVVLNGIVGGP